MALRTTTLGFPRTGARREMKVALEKYWGGELSEAELRAASEAVAAQSVQEQAAAGVADRCGGARGTTTCVHLNTKKYTRMLHTNAHVDRSYLAEPSPHTHDFSPSARTSTGAH